MVIDTTDSMVFAGRTLLAMALNSMGSYIDWMSAGPGAIAVAAASFALCPIVGVVMGATGWPSGQTSRVAGASVFALLAPIVLTAVGVAGWVFADL